MVNFGSTKFKYTIFVWVFKFSPLNCYRDKCFSSKSGGVTAGVVRLFCAKTCCTSSSACSDRWIMPIAVFILVFPLQFSILIVHIKTGLDLIAATTKSFSVAREDVEGHVATANPIRHSTHYPRKWKRIFE